MSWSAADLPDLSGVRFLVTGANSGIGLEACRALARKGAQVSMACRSADKGRAAVEAIRAEVPDADLELRSLDLADLSSVRGFAEAWGDRPLDVLVDNAGVMALPRRETAQGFEMQLGTNHLGHFALTGLLLPAMLERDRGRVVVVSSHAHRGGRIDFDDLQSERRYQKWVAYFQSKLANVLFMLELHRRLQARGSKVRSVGCHPGYAATNLQAAGPQMAGAPLRERAWGAVNAMFAQSAAKGALPTLYAAAAPDVESGEYFGPTGLGRWWGPPGRERPARQARDEETARRLWAVSEELTGVRFPL